MNILPIRFQRGHIFVEIGGNLWLLDTGAPTSFGSPRLLTIAGEQFNLETSYLGLTAATLSSFVGVPCVGLIGADVLGHFDHIFDVARDSLTVSTTELSHSGQSVCLDELQGIPIFTARIGGANYRMFFDTGAQISYFQDDSLTKFPFRETVPDFYPGIGQFQTDTYDVPVWIGGVKFILRCGKLPDPLGAALTMAGVSGIVGNQILVNRTVGYFPRRHTLVL